MAATQTSGKRQRRALGSWLAPARFVMFVMLLVVASAGLFVGIHDLRHAIMGGFDIAAFAFLASCAPLFSMRKSHDMAEYAAQNDANRSVLLAITGIVMAVILTVVAAELGEPTHGPIKLLILGTLILAWLFSNTIYAFHYAHLCYMQDGAREKGCGGVEFPGTKDPVYRDFLYFAFTLGMTFQTSDVQITDMQLRRAVIFHCFAAFLFNLGVIAFTISVLGAS